MFGLWVGFVKIRNFKIAAYLSWNIKRLNRLVSYLQGYQSGVHRVMTAHRILARRIVAVFIALAASIAFFAAISFSDTGSGEQLASFSSVPVPGASSQENTVGLAFGGRYALVAPFSPVNGNDNHFLYIIDTTNPGAPPVIKNLNGCYYPSNLLVTPQNGAFVRATFVGSDDGSFPPGEVIKYYNLRSNNGKVNIGNATAQMFYIQPVPGSDPTAIPTSFGVGNQGKVLVYTNGASIHAVTLEEGYDYSVDLVPEASYRPQVNPIDTVETFEAITSLQLDAATNIITVTVTGRYNAQNFTQLYFYHLNEDPGPSYGTVDLIKFIDKGQFPNSATMTPGSNAAVSPDGRWGYFGLDDGSLCRVRLAGDITSPKIDVIGWYSSMVAADPANRGPRIAQYDASSNSLALVKKGMVMFVRRPTNGRIGSVRRPTNIAISESPGIVFARFADDGTLAKAQEITNFGSNETSISNVGFDGAGGGVIATGGGSLLHVGLQATYVVGAVSAGIGQLSSGATPGQFVGLTSFDGSDSGVSNSGSFVLMNLVQSSVAGSSMKSSLTALPVVSVFHSALAGISGSVRRPCSLLR